MKNINLNTAEPKRQKPAELRRPILHHVKTVNYKDISKTNSFYFSIYTTTLHHNLNRTAWACDEKSNNIFVIPWTDQRQFEIKSQHIVHFPATKTLSGVKLVGERRNIVANVVPALAFSCQLGPLPAGGTYRGAKITLPKTLSRFIACFYFSSFEARIADAISSFKWRKWCIKYIWANISYIHIHKILNY